MYLNYVYDFVINNNHLNIENIIIFINREKYKLSLKIFNYIIITNSFFFKCIGNCNIKCILSIFLDFMKNLNRIILINYLDFFAKTVNK